MSHSIVPVIAAPLFDPEQARINIEVPAGLTVAQIVQLALPGIGVAPQDLRVTLVSEKGVAVIAPDLWSRVRPNAGVQVIIRGVPGKDVVRTVLLVAVSAAALAFAPTILAGTALAGNAFATSLVAAGLTLVGTLLVNALIPPPTFDSGERRNVYEISGWRNQIRRGEPVPLILGKHRYAPPFAATSWTEISRNDQYIRAMFCVGYGPVRISDIRIGDTSIDAYDDIDIEVFEGRPTDGTSALYPRQVLEEGFGTELVRPFPRDERGELISKVPNPDYTPSGFVADPPGWPEPEIDAATIETPVVRWTADDVSEISVILGLPGGLFRVNDEGKLRTRSVSVRIRARLNGVGAWTDIETLNISAKKRENFMRQFTWETATRGRYQVEITRLTDESTSTQVSDRMTLAAIQSIRPEYPLNMDKPLALIVVRVKATFQLNGALDNLNAIVEREGLIYEDDAWVAGYGRTPATAFLFALMSAANPYPVQQSEIDMETIADWHDWCLEKGLKYDRIHDQSESLGEMLLAICAAGRAAPRHDGIRWSVVIDRPQELVVDHLNPRNSMQFSWSRDYFVPPDAMRVRFLDATNNYQEAERVIPWPGHTGPIDLTEELQLPGKTDPDEIWRETRRRMYELIHRPDQFSVVQDGASRVATRGDLVMGNFDVLERTQAAARVKSVTGRMIEIDEWVDVGEAYGVRFRVYADDEDVIGSSVVRGIAAEPSSTALLRFVTDGPMPAPGEVVHIGPMQTESLALRLRGIEPGENLSSRLLLVAAAPIIDTLTDADTPPVWDGRVGAEVTPVATLPTAPRFLQVSVGTAEGAGATSIEVLLEEGTGSSANVNTFQIDHRLDGASVWTSITVPTTDGGAVISAYGLDDVVELRARALAGTTAGPFTPTLTLDVGSNQVASPPNVPSGAVLVTDQVGSALIEITAGTDADTDRFQIYRVPAGVLVDRAVHAIGPAIASTPSTTVSYTDTVVAGIYDYYVEAINDSGDAGELAGPFQLTVT